MNGSRNDGRGRQSPFDIGRMMRLFRGLRAEAIDRAPTAVREAVLRVVASLESDARPEAEDLAISLMWTMDRRARDLQRRKKMKAKPKSPSKPKPKPRRKKDRWGSDEGGEDSVLLSKRPAEVPGETVFARRLDEQEEERATENSPLRRAARRMGVSPSRVKTDASGRRIQILGDKQ